MTTSNFHFALRRLAQEGSTACLRLVRIGSHQAANKYDAHILEVAADGSFQFSADPQITAVNLGESPSAGGNLHDGTDTVAMDVEGKWIVFITPAGGASFPARIVQALSNENYTIREQAIDSSGLFTDAPGSADLTAANLAERSLGSGGAVPASQVVIVHVLAVGTSPALLKYAFDHPIYAKYLD